MKKLLKDKPRYYGRVDVDACIRGIAFVRQRIIEELEIYPEDMDLDDVSADELVDANIRHNNAMQEYPFALDPVTGLPHAHHIQTNLMFLERKRRKKEKADEASVRCIEQAEQDYWTEKGWVE